MVEFGYQAEWIEEEEQVADPGVVTLKSEGAYGKYALEPLPQGYGLTIGNPMRRVLLSSIAGTAVTWVKIDGAHHEYSTLPHVKEDVAEILMNVKGIRLRSHADRSGKLRLDVTGEGEIKASDVMTSADFEIVNPEEHLMTLDSPKAHLSMELNVEQGSGYVPAGATQGLPIGVLPVDAIFSPVRKVNFVVERTRVGQVTNYERLVLEIWTDGTITADDAVRKAANILAEHFFLFAGHGTSSQGGGPGSSLAKTLGAEQYNVPIEDMALSTRTRNALKRARINKVGEVLETSREDLQGIRNFGTKSLEELYDRLREMGHMLEEETPSDEAEDQGVTGEEDVPETGPDTNEETE